VAALEKGAVVIQYDAARASVLAPLLTPLATGQPLVALAPSTTLPSPVAVTAWTWSMTCTTSDPAAVRQFIHVHEGHGPGTP
jgi:hypothetical protein